MPVPLLRLEGFAVLALGVALHASTGSGWLLFAMLLFLPDLSMLGYLAGPRIGALAYNALHTYVAPILLGAIGWLASMPALLPLAAVWAAHIGMDRMLGYGLKEPTGFHDTHLGTIGRRRDGRI